MDGKVPFHVRVGREDEKEGWQEKKARRKEEAPDTRTEQNKIAKKTSLSRYDFLGE